MPTSVFYAIWLLRAFNVRNVPGPIFQAVKFGPVVGVPHNYLTEGLFGGVWGGGWEGVEMVFNDYSGGMAEKIKFVTDFEAFFLENLGGGGRETRAEMYLPEQLE